MVAINRQENKLYEAFVSDNGPDYVSDGFFRIIMDNKIGYADSVTGRIVIKPQFKCAWPFKNGIAEVSFDCTEETDGEHKTWLSNSWFYINKKGEILKRYNRNK